MPQFRKKLVVVDAMQWRGDNLGEVLAFTAGRGGPWLRVDDGVLEVNARPGATRVELDGWLLRSKSGEFYALTDSVFRESYEPVEVDADAG